MKLRLPEEIVSPQDLKFVISEVRGYARWSSKAQIKQRLDATSAAEPPVISTAATTMIQAHLANTADPSTLEELINDLEAFESSVARVTITLAAPAASGLQKTLAAWCRANIDPDILVSFGFNTTLLGGMIVRYGSRIFDWSLRRQILEARSRFPEILRHV